MSRASSNGCRMRHRMLHRHLPRQTLGRAHTRWRPESHAFCDASASSAKACTRANTLMAHPTEAPCLRPAQPIFQACKHDEALMHTQQRLHIRFARQCRARASDTWHRLNDVQQCRPESPARQRCLCLHEQLTPMLAQQGLCTAPRKILHTAWALSHSKRGGGMVHSLT